MPAKDFETSKVEEVDFSSMSQDELIKALMASSNQLKQESANRKALANEVLDVKGNIRVFCRIVPSSVVSSKVAKPHFAKTSTKEP